MTWFVKSNLAPAPGRSTPEVFVQETEPTGAKKGDLWFKPSTCELKIFTEDN